MFYISNKQVDIDRSISWIDNAVVGTANNIDFSKPFQVADQYMITVANPSTITGLTIKIFAKAVGLGGSDQYAYITTLSFPANDTQIRYVSGIFAGTDIRIVVSNDTALGVGNAFTATLRIREVN